MTLKRLHLVQLVLLTVTRFIQVQINFGLNAQIPEFNQSTGMKGPYLCAHEVHISLTLMNKVHISLVHEDPRRLSG